MRITAVVLLLVLSVACSHHACFPLHMQEGALTEAGFDDVRVVTGSSGPPVIVLHEAPGMTQEDIAFARRLAAKGFTVYMPLLFGNVGEANMVKNFFTGWSTLSYVRARPSPGIGRVIKIGKWVSDKHHGAKVGVVGMCGTGDFPAFLTSETWFGAGVMSQPAMPSFGKSRITGSGTIDTKKPLLYFRFRTDKISPQEKLVEWRKVIPNLESRLISGGCGDHPHSVLAEDFIDQPGDETRLAFDRVVEVFNAALR